MFSFYPFDDVKYIIFFQKLKQKSNIFPLLCVVDLLYIWDSDLCRGMIEMF